MEDVGVGIFCLLAFGGMIYAMKINIRLAVHFAIVAIIFAAFIIALLVFNCDDTCYADCMSRDNTIEMCEELCTSFCG